LCVESIVAIYKKNLEAEESAVFGALHSQSGFSSFRFSINQSDGFRQDSSPNIAVDAVDACWDCSHALHVRIINLKIVICLRLEVL
jgi:hypothetical protein